SGLVVGDPVAAKPRVYAAGEFIPDAKGNQLWSNTAGGTAPSYRVSPGVVRHLFMGRIESGFTWLSEPDSGWLLDEKVPSMQLTRLSGGGCRLFVSFVNHNIVLKGAKRVRFALLTHPAGIRPVDHRNLAWLNWTAGKPGPVVPTLDLAGFDALREQKNAACLRGDAAGAFDAFTQFSLLEGPAGGEITAGARNHAQAYPFELFNYLAGRHTGLVVRMDSNSSVLTRPGANPAPDRVLLARALCHDIGLDASRLAQPMLAARIVDIMQRFGLFEADGQTLFLPSGRQQAVRYGLIEADEAYDLGEDSTALLAKVSVSVYVRPAGDKARKALIIISNENDKPVREQLYITQPEVLFDEKGNQVSSEKLL
ncbi:MAG: hypothetical protein HQL31_07520, partial [Planctomycetes bacterium]|nr:hypothetical protein [Planctomycetota bacterium]